MFSTVFTIKVSLGISQINSAFKHFPKIVILHKHEGPSFGEVGSGREQLNSVIYYITTDEDNLQLCVADKENH